MAILSFSASDIVKAYIRATLNRVSFLDVYGDCGMTVAIIDNNTKAPMASGFAKWNLRDRCDPYNALRIAARRACEDYAIRYVANDAKNVVERELYRAYRKQGYEQRKKQMMCGDVK